MAATTWSQVCNRIERSQNRRKIVIDCDAGFDDCEAIMLLLASPNIDVVGITCVNGNVSVAQVSHNVRRILSTCGREDVPIYVGAEAPLVERRRDASYFHGKDGLGDAGTQGERPQAEWPTVSSENAVDALIRLAKEHLNARDMNLQAVAAHHTSLAAGLAAKAHSFADKKDYILASTVDQSVYDERERAANATTAAARCAEHACGPQLEIVALGPLTNIAIACRLDPAFAASVRQLYIMGGTSRARGNVPGFPTAEFNCHADPDAMQICLQAFISPIVVSWECCEDHSLEWDEILQWRKADTPKARFLSKTGDSIVKTCLEKGWLYVPCDPLCAAVALYPSLLVAEAGVEHRYCQVQRGLGPACYQTVVDRDGLTECAANCWIVTHVDKNSLNSVLRTMTEDKAEP